MTTEGVLVEYESTTNNEIYTNSGLLLSDRYVIITGNVLTPYLKELDLNKWLSKLKPGILNYDIFPTEPKLRVVIKRNHLLHKKARVIAAFVCKNILKSSGKYLRDWAIDSDDKKQIREIISLFFVLKIGNFDKLDIKNESLENEKLALNTALLEVLENARNLNLSIGHEVFIESVPFGNRAFVGSYSQGVISNITGEKSCFLLTDCPSAPGSEGSPVFIKTQCKNKFLIGIVISCLNWWKGEWVGLTLAANLVPLLSQLLEENCDKLKLFKNPTCGESNAGKELLDASTKSLVQIVCGSGWGTGILIDKNKGIFLTNSHVIESDDNIILHWQNQQTKATLIYKTPNSDVYDLAVLKCETSVIRKWEMTQVGISLKQAEIGEEVYAVGYSLFSRDLKPKPSLTKGHISQIHASMIKTTCTILPGASGGAIFRPNGQLIAVIVSNTKMDDKGVVYPRINMSIPVLAVYSIIDKFLQTGDSKRLKSLHSNDSSANRPWNFFCGKL